MVEMQCGMCTVVWNVCCGIVMCNLYLDVMCVAWCYVGMMWNGAPRCEMWCDQYMSNVVRCGMLQFQTWCRIEMQNV